MKHFLVLTLVIGLGIVWPATVRSQSDPWRWILTEAVGDHWETLQGIADVEISGNEIHIRLRRSDKDLEGQFEIEGTIHIGELGKDRRGIQEGTLRVIVTRLASDIRPSVFVGTYWKAIYSPRARESFGTQYSEIIVLSDPINTVSLLKETKVQPASGAPPN